MSLKLLRSKLEQQKGRRAQIEQAIVKLNRTLEEKRVTLIQHEQAREVLRTAGLVTQQSLSYHIGEVASLALESVFDDPYSLTVEFVQRRNKTECDLYFVRREKRIEPMSASGGGSVDVASFALRVASWSMQHPHNRNVIMLDEPLKNLSTDLQEKGSSMLREISKKLGIQFIIITHEEILTSYADRIFKVDIHKGVSKITVSENENEANYLSD